MSKQPSFDDVGESNPETKSLSERTATVNEAGGEAFEPDSDRYGLYKVVLNNLLEDTHYDSTDESFDKVWSAFEDAVEADPEFPLQLAVYARHEEGLRDIAQLLLVLSANHRPGTDGESIGPAYAAHYVQQYTPAIIDRTDEFMSVLSYQIRGFGKPVPRPLRRGIEDALHEKYAIVEYEDGSTERVTYVEPDQEPGDEDIVATTSGPVSDILDEGYVHDEYTFSKYRGDGKQVSLYDVLNLVRPNPRSDNRDELFGRIAHGELDEYEDVDPLRQDRTWEATRSDDEDDRSEAEQWHDRLEDMGLMARVRNMRNMLEAGLSGDEIFDYDQ